MYFQHLSITSLYNTQNTFIWLKKQLAPSFMFMFRVFFRWCVFKIPRHIRTNGVAERALATHVCLLPFLMHEHHHFTNGSNFVRCVLTGADLQHLTWGRRTVSRRATPLARISLYVLFSRRMCDTTLGLCHLNMHTIYVS